MAKRKMTIEELARMVKRGFDLTASKEDLKGFATKEDLKGFATKEDLKGFATKEDFKTVVAELERLGADIRDIRINTSMLASASGNNEYDIKKLQFRVGRLEKKTGLVK